MPLPMIEQIINVDDPEQTVRKAKDLAQKLRSKTEAEARTAEAKEASKTQIRKLFATLRQIQMTWQQDDKSGYRELVMFGPRLAYQSAKHPALTPLVEDIQAGIQAVGNDKQKLQRLVDYFEATVAYYIVNLQGGK